MIKTVKYIFNALLYVFAGITILLLILSLIGIKPYVTISGSMEPTIMTGSACFVDLNAEYQDTKIDDVIAFKVGGTLITHRVQNITENGIITKGDNNEVPDGIITNNNNFVGKTLFSIPYVGYAIMFFKKPFGLCIIVIALITLLVLNIKDFLPSKQPKQLPCKSLR